MIIFTKVSRYFSQTQLKCEESLERDYGCFLLKACLTVINDNLFFSLDAT
jgi:hypothetical protein